MYVSTNFKTKKVLKEAIQAGRYVFVWQPGPFGGREPTNGWVSVEGPYYPEPHRWWAEVLLKDGIIVKVK
jgi:hypothetical protein